MSYIERFCDFVEVMGETKDHIKQLERENYTLSCERANLRGQLKRKQALLDYIDKNFLDLGVVDLMSCLELDIPKDAKDEVRKQLQGKDPYRKRAGD